MCRFTEAICIEKGIPRRIEYHNRRCNATRVRFFPGCKEIDLEDVLWEKGYLEDVYSKKEMQGEVPPAAHPAGRRKCRVEYGRDIVSVTVTPYVPRRIERLRLVYDDTIEYTYKYADRRDLERLARQTAAAAGETVVLIVKNGRLTDTTFSNIALFDGDRWTVPDTCLLSGTMRQYLLDHERVREAPVTPENLHRYQSISLINAMLDLGETVVPLSNVDF